MTFALIAAKAALKAQTKAAQHMEACARCQRLFLSALKASAEEDPMFLREGAFGITVKIIRELRDCSEWPTGA